MNQPQITDKQYRHLTPQQRTYGHELWDICEEVGKWAESDPLILTTDYHQALAEEYLNNRSKLSNVHMHNVPL